MNTATLRPTAGRKREICALLRPPPEKNCTSLIPTHTREEHIIFFQIPRIGKHPLDLKKDKPGHYRFARRVSGVWINFKLSAEDSLVRDFAGNEKPLTARVETEDVGGHIVVKLSAVKKTATHVFGILPNTPSKKEGDIITTSEKMRGVSILIRRTKQ